MPMEFSVHPGLIILFQARLLGYHSAYRRVLHPMDLLRILLSRFANVHLHVDGR